MWRLCGHAVLLPWMDSEFSALSAASLLVLSELSRKFRRSWFVLVATSLLVLLSISASFCHTWELDAASWLCSLTPSFPVLFQPGWLFDAKWTLHSQRTCRNMRDQVQRRFRLQQSSLLLSLHAFFASVSGQLVELKFREQQIELKWLMSHKWRTLFHSSRVKFPFVNMSASWCLVSTYLIWIFGSRLILSNTQSRATLWVLDTCLIVGLLSLIIILITASLSSKTCYMAPNREGLTLRSWFSRTSWYYIVKREQVQPCDSWRKHRLQHLRCAKCDGETITWHQRSKFDSEDREPPSATCTSKWSSTTSTIQSFQQRITRRD